MSWSDFDKNGMLIERGDDTTHTVTTYDESGAVTSTRPYTAEENAERRRQGVAQRDHGAAHYTPERVPRRTVAVDAPVRGGFWWYRA